MIRIDLRRDAWLAGKWYKGRFFATICLYASVRRRVAVFFSIGNVVQPVRYSPRQALSAERVNL